jgi:hypothetical protein
MSPTETDHTVQLSHDEREELLWLLDRALGEARIEERHSAGFDYRRQVQHEEDLLRSMIAKLRVA